MKKLLSIVLALCFVLSMTGVALAEDVQTINVCIGSQPETLDPQLNSASDGSNYIKHLFEGLMKYGWNGEGVVNGVADNYTVSDDGLVYTFHIRDDAKWSDGQDLTAEDFEYTFKRLVDPATAAPYAGDMGKYLKNGLAISNGEMSVDELGAHDTLAGAHSLHHLAVADVDPDVALVPDTEPGNFWHGAH